MNILNKKYSSESIADIYRDVQEAFFHESNDLLTEDLREDQLVKVTFSFEDKQKVVLISSQYDVMTVNDIEKDLDDAITDVPTSLNLKVDEYSFYDGTFHLLIDIVD